MNVFVGKKQLLRDLQKLGKRNIFVQIPEGLKAHAFEISTFLEKNGFDVVTSVEPCYGACDLRDREAKELGCEVVLHMGHSDLGIKAAIPVVYHEIGIGFDPTRTLEKNMSKIGEYEKVGLLATVQYLESLRKAKDFLEKRKKRVFIGKSGKLHSGQVLGCDYSAAEAVEDKAGCFIFIGSGKFHSTGLAQATKKPVFFLDAESGQFSEISVDRKKLEIKRLMRIEKARQAALFAVFASTKPGQNNIKKARKIREIIKKKGKRAFIITADALTPEKIMGMGIEVLVNTACPRIYDDQETFKTVILNPEDVKPL